MIYSGDDTYQTLDDLAPTVTAATKRLREVVSEFDAIVVQGMSGVIVGAPTALRLRKPLVVIRKDSDDSHHGSGRLINRDKVLGRRMIFLDDFISGGETFGRVSERIELEGGRVVGKYLYRDDDLELAS